MDAETAVRRRQRRLREMLRALRRRRGLTIAAAAKAIGLPKRTYEYFEAGAALHLDLDRVRAAAKALNADLYAILAALEMSSPAFALRCADNKLAYLLVLAVMDFDAALGDDIALLDPQTLMSHFEGMFASLAAIAQARRALLEPPPPDDVP